MRPMDAEDRLAGRFEASRPRLRAMAYRMLGSLGDAEDAVQEGWMHASAAGTEDVANLEGWFTTIVARVCLDMLRSRKSRREDRAWRPGGSPRRAGGRDALAVRPDRPGQRGPWPGHGAPRAAGCRAGLHLR